MLKEMENHFCEDITAIKEKITNAHIVAYNKIPENQKLRKGNYMKELLIELNLIEDKVIFFKVKNNINIIFPFLILVDLLVFICFF